MLTVLVIDSFRPYLLPPTPSSGPASPLVSDQESEEGQLNDKGTTIDYGIEEIKKGNKFIELKTARSRYAGT